MSVDGGGRVEGLNLETRLRNLCTTAFVVTNGETNAITTAAHCPDELTYVDRDGTSVTLPMIGSWGAAYRDVQLNGSPNSPEPFFYSNRGAGTLRRLVSWRNVASTRAGDFVCHYGESSGYSCATVELTDYAPPGRSVRRPLLTDLGHRQRPELPCRRQRRAGVQRRGRVRHRQGRQPRVIGPVPVLLLYVDGLSAAAVAAAGRGRC